MEVGLAISLAKLVCIGIFAYHRFVYVAPESNFMVQNQIKTKRKQKAKLITWTSSGVDYVSKQRRYKKAITQLISSTLQKAHWISAVCLRCEVHMGNTHTCVLRQITNWDGDEAAKFGQNEDDDDDGRMW